MTGRAALLLAWLLAPTPALAADPAADALRTLLSQYEGLPEAEKFRARVSDPVEALLRLTGDAGAPAWLRLRAIDALSRFPEPAVSTHLEAVIDAATSAAPQAPASPEVHASLAVYLRTFPTAPAAVGRLRAALRHPDAELRATALRVAERSPEAALRLEAAAHAARNPAVLDPNGAAAGRGGVPTLR
jgi:hypothetical protein